MATSIGSTQDTTSLLDKINGASATQTSKGTRIVKPGQDMDKNAFLRILSAELSNQDPTNAKDGTEYVAQMAQFAGLEQMANLNGSIRLSSANSLIGKMVSLNQYDEKGNQYVGQVVNVSKNGDDIKLGVLTGQETDANGNVFDILHDFDMSNVVSIEDMSYWSATKGSTITESKSSSETTKTE